MKIAGRKNDGAWFRTNAVLRKMSSQDKAALLASLQDNMLFLEPYFNDLQSLQAEAGITIAGAPATATAFLSNLITIGIPRQVWMGKMTFTTYSKVEAGMVDGHMTYDYIPNYVGNAASFGNELRGFMKRYIYALRQTRDVFQLGFKNQGNPGGIADAHGDAG